MIMALRRRDLLMLAGGGLTLVACGGGGSVPQDSFYRLTIDDPGRRYGKPLLDGTVEVTRFEADGLTSERALVYQESGPTLRQYRTHYWVDTPTRLLQEATVKALRAAEAAPRVVTPDARVRSDYRVAGRLERLQHSPGDGGAAGVIVAAEFEVTQARSGGLVLLRRYETRREVVDDSVPAAAVAFRDALTDIMGRFLDDLAEANGVGPEA